MSNFKKEAFDMGEVGVTDKVTTFFELDELKADDIQYIWPGCGCSDAWYEDGKVYMTIDISQAGDWKEARMPINKHAFVRLNDGEQEFIADPQKRRKTNEKRKLIRLHAFGVVVK